MEIVLTTDLEAKLAHLASQQGQDSQALVVEAVERLVEYDTWFIGEVEKGLMQVDTGQTLSHEEVGNRLQSKIASKLSAA